jgi:serine/threonine-protein kinase
MAPEIVEGKPLDFRTDVFSVGIMLYLLATGNLPFQGRNPHEVLRRITEGKFIDPRSAGRGVDEGLARIITRSLARRPEDRYADVGPMAADLLAYLAPAQLSDVRAELKAYFADPAGYDAALPARLAPALTTAATGELRERRSAKALELWNRVLAFDPGNVAVATALRKLEGRARLRNAGLALGLALAVGTGGWAAARALRRAAPAGHPAKTPPVALLAPAPTVKAGPTPAGPLPSVGAAPIAAAELPRRATGAAPHLSRTPSRAEPRPAPDTSAKPFQMRSFKLGPTPQNVDVYLDGERQFGYDVDHTTISVPWAGVHVIEFKSPGGCCFGERVEVGPDRPLPPDDRIARRLKWKPAHLVVTIEPPGTAAKVMVREPDRPAAATTARAGEEVDIPFFTDDDSSKEVEISVDAGDAFASEHLRVRAGQRIKHVIKLKTGGN